MNPAGINNKHTYKITKLNHGNWNIAFNFTYYNEFYSSTTWKFCSTVQSFHYRGDTV